MNQETYTKFYCENCGKWLGVFDKQAKLEGVFPYCNRCKEAVPITNKVSTYNRKISAKVPND